MARGDTTAALYDQLFTRDNVKCRHISLKALGHQGHGRRAFLTELEMGRLIEDFQNLLGVIPQRAQQYRGGQLATTIDPHIHKVFGIKFKIEPGTTVRNHPGAIKQLA